MIYIILGRLSKVKCLYGFLADKLTIGIKYVKIFTEFINGEYAMKLPATRIEKLNIEPGKRILAVSDIHGCLDYLRGALEKVHFSDDDILFIVGDIIEKGPDSLGTLRYIMELCKKGNVVPLIGNVDASRLIYIDRLSENADMLFDYIVWMRTWHASFYDQLALECGYNINSVEDLLESKNAVLERFEEELSFLTSLPTVVETQNYVFVHGGLAEKDVDANKDKDLFELLKRDAFMTGTKHHFDKYVVVGHWPVTLYGSAIPQFDPIFDQEKKIISIDGGCGIKDECQMNVLVIPDINCAPDDISFVSYDELPTIRALTAQKPSSDSLLINWLCRKIRIIERGEEFSLIEHEKSGRRLYIPNTYLKSDTDCRDYTDYMLPVEAGDRLSLITKTSKGCIAKKDGVVGWYCGEYLPWGKDNE